jgi:hypothetical protein
MPQRERSSLFLDDPDGRRLHAVWSRSGARLGLAIWKTRPFSDLQQVQLREEQVEKLIRFLEESLARNRRER